uniref:Uncharacterized protein n=1 Tax=Magallana gigas TaxID=29159 RepID=K1R9C9_MAGGI
MASFSPDYYLRQYGSDQVPLSLGALQLEPADRAVLKIAGNVHRLLKMDTAMYRFRSESSSDEPPSPTAMAHYEQNRRKETDERDAVQKKTFTKWVNKHLLKCCPQKIIKIDKHRPSPCLATGGCGSGLILWDQLVNSMFDTINLNGRLACNQELIQTYG